MRVGVVHEVLTTRHICAHFSGNSAPSATSDGGRAQSHVGRLLVRGSITVSAADEAVPNALELNRQKHAEMRRVRLGIWEGEGRRRGTFTPGHILHMARGTRGRTGLSHSQTALLQSNRNVGLVPSARKWTSGD